MNAVDMSDKLIEIDLLLIRLNLATGSIRKIKVLPKVFKAVSRQIALQRELDPDSKKDCLTILARSAGLTLDEAIAASQYCEEGFPYELCSWRHLKSQLNEAYIEKLHTKLIADVQNK